MKKEVIGIDISRLKYYCSSSFCCFGSIIVFLLLFFFYCFTAGSMKMGVVISTV